jgi:hypothetical protein
MVRVGRNTGCCVPCERQVMVRVGRNTGCCVPSERQLTARYALLDTACISNLRCTARVQFHVAFVIHRRYLQDMKRYSVSVLPRSRALLWEVTVAKKISEFYVKDALRYFSGARSHTVASTGAHLYVMLHCMNMLFVLIMYCGDTSIQRKERHCKGHDISTPVI